MCSIQSVRHSPHSTTGNKVSHRTISLKLIEKRLNHLRQELQNLTKKDLFTSSSSSSSSTNEQQQQQIDDNDDHQVQYRKRLTQLLRSHDKQV